MKGERHKDDPTKHVMLLTYLLDYTGSYAYLHRKVVFHSVLPHSAAQHRSLFSRPLALSNGYGKICLAAYNHKANSKAN